MDRPTSQEDQLSGPVADVEGQTEVPSSPHGSAISQQSSTSHSSAHSSHSSPTSRLRQKQLACRKYCSTVLACLAVGVMITLGSVAMTVCGYFAMNIASQTVQSGNKTAVVLDEQLHENLYKFRTFGPVMIGFGSFLIMCACVLLCEEKDKKHKSRTHAGENLLSEHERIMQEARERFYNENRNVLLVESNTVDYRNPKASSNECTSCLESENVRNSAITQVKPLASSAAESDGASGVSGSPVVLVHGPTIIEPAQCAVSDEHQQTNENGMSDIHSKSNHNSPDHKSSSPSRNSKKHNAVRPSSIEDAKSELAFPISPVLPKIDSPRGSNGISRAGGAIPKSILVQPLKLSPIRSVNGPIRVRLDDSPTELSPFAPSNASKSAECIPQPRSPGSTSGRVKRGKKKKSAGSLQASLGQCRCLSDPSMSTPRSQDRQLDSCCCLQPDCCWGSNCQLDKSVSTNAKNTDDPLAGLVATGGKSNIPLLQPLNSDCVPIQSIELKPKSIGELVAADREKSTNKHKDTCLDTHYKNPHGVNQITNSDKDTLRDATPPKGAASPARQVDSDKERSALGGEKVTTDETNAEALAIKDRNSNIKVSSKRQDAPGKGAPNSGQAKGGVIVK
ncbi:uncharacterized protein LOC119728618 [Patiria miniata]|uniref:Uncharacterized protein n=1 Tax=Patiria miniata TaxID=46514 RepID=A0A913ZZG7_PATMI|nr:uncharacterized protein LOC119728618 [Patiria miniata]